jgi:hypothetical protein
MRVRLRLRLRLRLRVRRSRGRGRGRGQGQGLLHLCHPLSTLVITRTNSSWQVVSSFIVAKGSVLASSNA